MSNTNTQQRATLPPKELSLFKRIVKSYEHKQYKNGLKFAKQVLSNPKFSEHGETLAMKGLILNCVGKKEEAYECCKKGLKNDIRSSICWHVYGLLQKSDRKYDEAIKCYLQALRLDKENMQILRDLSLLQMQMRDIEGYKDTRYKLFVLRPSHKASWIGYAMAYDILGNKDQALHILEEFRKAQSQPKPYDYEHSELLLYMASLMLQSGKYENALEHLKRYEKDIVDLLALEEDRGELLIKLNRMSEAADVYWRLVDRNPENKNYYEKLETVLGKNTVEQKMELYNEICRKYPRATMAKKQPLFFLSGEAFRRHADSYLKPALRKGVPPLFVQLQPLYDDDEKVAILEELITGYKYSLETCERLESTEETDDNHWEPPSTLIWTNYLLAQHYCRLNKFKEALDIVETQLEHTPTLIEFYALKGQIYREAGDIWTASNWLIEAQSLDTADRFINCQCVRYLIQAGRMQEAEDMAAKFTRESTSAADHLNEMQCMWFLTEAAKSYRRSGKLGDSLKKSHEVERHFCTMMEDQIDFHSYCLRKMTLRAYVEMLNLEDKLRSHPFFFDAARNAIEIYLHLSEHPVGDEDNLNEAESKNLSAAEMKKMRNKQRKAKKKAEQEAVRAKMEQDRRDAAQRSKQNQGEKDQDNEKAQEEKLDPAKLARPDKPLEEATKFLEHLLSLSSNRIETHCLAYKVYEKKERPLLMLRAIKRGVKLGGLSHPEFHECYVRFLLYRQNCGDTLPEIVRSILDDEMESIYPSGDERSPHKINEKFIKENSQSLLPILSGAIVKYMIEGDAASEHCLKMIQNIKPSMQGYKWQNCDLILQSLRKNAIGSLSDTILDELRQRFATEFPYSIVFLTSQQLDQLKQEEFKVTYSLCQTNSNAGDSQTLKQTPSEHGDEEMSSISESVSKLSMPGMNHESPVNGDHPTAAS